MKKLEKILGAIILLAIILKFNLLPGGSFFLGISFSILAIIYYPFGFALFNEIRLKNIFKKDSYKGISVLRIIGAIGIGTGLSIVCIGILFKIEDLPGASVNLSVGLLIVIITSIISLIKYIKNKSKFYQQILLRVLIIGGFGLIMFLTPELLIVKVQFRNHPDYIKAYSEYLNNPESDELRKIKEIELNKATMTEEDFKQYMDYKKRQTELK